MTENPDAKKYDLFISYAAEDRSWVQGYLLDALRQSQITCHTEEAFDLGKPRLLAFEEAVQQSHRILLVLSPAFLLEGHTLFIDLLAEQYGLETGTWPVIPLIVKPVQQLPLRLRILKSLDATDPVTRESTLELLADALQRPLAPPVQIPEPPYPGLRSFTAAEDDKFFGRSREIGDICNLLRSHGFLALIGPSGSGKSSLARAGVVAGLRKGGFLGSDSWLIREVRPGEAPMAALTAALGGDPANLAETIAALLSRDSGAQRLFLLVDQFEEIFTVAKDDTSRFQKLLIDLGRLPNTYVLLTVRADFYPRLMDPQVIWKEIKDHRYEVLPLDEKGLAEAIVKPAEQAGVYIEAALVERIVGDAGNEPGILPFVQETMRLLWEKVERRYLPMQAYEMLVLPRSTYGERQFDQVAGLQAAIAMHADGVFLKLDDQQQPIAQRIFVRLVQFGEGRSHTRRQQLVSQLQGSLAPEVFDPVLDHLGNEESRLLILGGKEKGAEREVDIAHEALIGAWPRLVGWLDQQRKAEEFRRRFEADASQWIGSGKDPSFLYGGTRLDEAIKWQMASVDELNDEHRAFLHASARQDQRRRRVERILRAVVAILALIGVLAIGYSAWLAFLKLSAQGKMAHFEAGPALLAPNRQPVNLPAFSLEMHEVSNRQYQLCVEAGRCSPPNEPAGYQGIDFAARKDHPVAFVTAYQAAVYCDWIGRRLPTALEWERAARGQEGRAFPWPGEAQPSPERVRAGFLQSTPPIGGTDDQEPGAPPELGEPPTAQASERGQSVEDTLPCIRPEAPVAVDDPAYQDGATPERIMHLLGNVAEWTSTPSACQDTYTCQESWNGVEKVPALRYKGYSYVLCLEPATDDANQGFLIRHSEAEPTLSTETLGFRCADS